MKRIVTFGILIVVVTSVAMALSWTKKTSTSISKLVVNHTIDTVSGVTQLIPINDPASTNAYPKYKNALITVTANIDTTTDVTGVTGCWGTTTDSAKVLLYGWADGAKTIIQSSTKSAMTVSANAVMQVVVRDTGTTGWAFYCDEWQVDVMISDSCGNATTDSLTKKFSYVARLSGTRDF